MGMTFQALTGTLGINTSRWTKGLANASKAAKGFSARMTSAFKRIGKAAIKAAKLIAAAGAAAAAALAVAGVSALKTAATFEKAMDRVGAITQATAEEMENLTKLAREMGRTTVFTATEAAGAMNVFAIAGLNTEQIMAALPATLDLAAASGADISVAADIAAKTMTSMGLESKDMSHIMDVLTRTFTTSNTTIESLGESMKLVAPIGSQAGQSLEELGAIIGILGDNGIQGSMAGTTLRSALLALVKPSAGAKKELGKLGVEIADANGKILPMTQIVGQLNQATAGMTDEKRLNVLGKIFPTRSLSGVLALLKSGAPEIARRTKDLEDSQGITARIAKQQMDNFAGSWKILQSAMESVRIAIGNKLIPIIRPLVDMYVAWLQKNEEMIAQKWGDRLMAVVAAVKWLWGGVSALIPVLIEWHKWYVDLVLQARDFLLPLLKEVGDVIVDTIVPAGEKMSGMWQTFLDILDDFWKDVGPSVMELFDEIGVIMVEWGQTIGKNVIKIWQQLTGEFDQFTSTTGVTIQDWWQFFKQTIIGVVDAFRWVSKVSGVVANTLITMVGGAIQQLINGLGTLGTAIVQAFSGDFEGALDTMKNGWDEAVDINQETADDLVNIWSGGNEEMARDTWNGIKEQVKAVVFGEDAKVEAVVEATKIKTEAWASETEVIEREVKKQIEVDDTLTKKLLENAKKRAQGRNIASRKAPERNFLLESGGDAAVRAAGAGFARAEAQIRTKSPLQQIAIRIRLLQGQIAGLGINLRKGAGRLLRGGFLKTNAGAVREKMLMQLQKLVKMQEDELRRRRRLRLRQFRRFQESRAEADRRRREARDVFGQAGGPTHTGPTRLSRGPGAGLNGGLSSGVASTILNDNGTVNVQMTFTERITPESARRIQVALDAQLKRAGVDSFGRSPLRSGSRR